MKILKVKSIVYSLLAIMVLSVFMTSCEQEAIPTPEISDTTYQQVQVVSSNQLPESDVRVAELKTIVESEVTAIGTPQFDAVTFVEYSEPGATALILPFTTEGETKTTTLISYFADGVYTNSFYLEISPTETYLKEVADNIDAAYSGEVTFYTKNSEVMVKSTVIEGIEVMNYTNTELRSCMSDCLEYAWNVLPWWMKIPCGGSFGACVYAGQIYACSVIAGCVGGMVWYCWYDVCRM